MRLRLEAGSSPCRVQILLLLWSLLINILHLRCDVLLWILYFLILLFVFNLFKYILLQKRLLNQMQTDLFGPI